MEKFSEFKHIRQFWMPKHQSYGVKIKAGEYYVTVQDEMIATVLGSCIAVCIRDPKAGVGGINHFILPDTNNDILSASNRYGVFAMEQLINGIIKRGGKRENLEIKLAGGGNIMGGSPLIAQRNIKFIKDFLATEGYRITSEDLGGNRPRRMLYNITRGKLLVQKLNSQHHQELEIENMVKNTPLPAQDYGDVELFAD